MTRKEYEVSFLRRVLYAIVFFALLSLIAAFFSGCQTQVSAKVRMEPDFKTPIAEVGATWSF